MMKQRVAVPQRIREQILKEFNHSCALCGANNPQVHHIDEDPSNNDPNNLLPLCPNCHLIDQHNPTARIQPEKLQLFRKYKDPTILSTRFEPLFNRLQFLDSVQDDMSTKELSAKADELVAFAKALQMGEFYAQKMKELVEKPRRAYVISLDGYDPQYERQRKLDQQQYREQLREVRDQVYALAVEMLRYQAWDKN